MQKGKRFLIYGMKQAYKSLLHLVYPEYCSCCEKELTSNQRFICVVCENELHYTDFEKYTSDTELDKLFWGRVLIDTVFSLVYYKKNTQARNILHHLKYDNRPDLAEYMGELIGRRIYGTEFSKKIDVLIPVPLHDKKKYIRGYNQSELIAKGISTITNIPTDFLSLKRVLHTDSQTKKGKFERWDNVQSAFVFSNDFSESIKHIAIVDDVITTGATLETIIRTIRQSNKEVEISIISIAYAGG